MKNHNENDTYSCSGSTVKVSNVSRERQSSDDQKNANQGRQDQENILLLAVRVWLLAVRAFISVILLLPVRVLLLAVRVLLLAVRVLLLPVRVFVAFVPFFVSFSVSFFVALLFRDNIALQRMQENCVPAFLRTIQDIYNTILRPVEGGSQRNEGRSLGHNQNRVIQNDNPSNAPEDVSVAGEISSITDEAYITHQQTDANRGYIAPPIGGSRMVVTVPFLPLTAASRSSINDGVRLERMAENVQESSSLYPPVQGIGLACQEPADNVNRNAPIDETPSNNIIQIDNLSIGSFSFSGHDQ